MNLRVHDPDNSRKYLKKVQKLIHVFDQKSPRELNVIDSEDEQPEELVVLEPRQNLTDGQFPAWRPSLNSFHLNDGRIKFDEITKSSIDN